MAQVKVYAFRSELNRWRVQLSDSVHASLVHVLKLPESKRFQRFFPLDPADFIFPPDRSERYTIIEIEMFTGRNPDTLQALIRDLQARWVRDLGADPNDLELVLHQTPAEQWGIRGQLGHELTLNYEVNV